MKASQIRRGNYEFNNGSYVTLSGSVGMLLHIGMVVDSEATGSGVLMGLEL